MGVLKLKQNRQSSV